MDQAIALIGHDVLRFQAVLHRPIEITFTWICTESALLAFAEYGISASFPSPGSGGQGASCGE